VECAPAPAYTRSDMRDLPVLVAGGGIAGLAAALALARKGIASLVLEQAGTFETVGAGLQIGPNAVKALRYLEAWEDLAPQCVAPESFVIRDAMSGNVLRVIPLSATFEQRFGAPYRVAHRADLLSALAAAVARSPLIEVRHGSRVAAIAETASGVTVSLADGAAVSGSHLVGADGIRSVARATIDPGRQPVYRGQALYRALVPIEYAPSDLAENVVTLWMGSGFHLVSYRVSGGEDLNLILSADSTWTDTSWSVPASADDIARLSPGGSKLFASSPVLARWLKWAGYDLDSAPSRWHSGRIVLSGDAAHATLPFLAQGAAMALEDAVTLSNNWGNFERYTALRQPRTARIQSESRGMTRVYHAAGLTRLARNTLIKMASSELFLSRLSWIYQHDPVSAG